MVAAGLDGMGGATGGMAGVGRAAGRFGGRAGLGLGVTVFSTRFAGGGVGGDGAGAGSGGGVVSCSGTAEFSMRFSRPLNVPKQRPQRTSPLAALSWSAVMRKYVAQWGQRVNMGL